MCFKTVFGKKLPVFSIIFTLIVVLGMTACNSAGINIIDLDDPDPYQPYQPAEKTQLTLSANHTKEFDSTTCAPGLELYLIGAKGVVSIYVPSIVAEYVSPYEGTTTIRVTALTLIGADKDNYYVILPAYVEVEGITAVPPPPPTTIGEMWHEALSRPNTTNRIEGITYGAYNEQSRFVAVGMSRRIMWSDDGKNWNDAVSNPFVSNQQLFDVAYGNGIFVTGGNNGEMAWSYDGKNWTLVTDSTFGTATINGIAYGGGKFVAVGNHNDITGSCIAVSTDGKTWNYVISVGAFNSIVHTGSRFVASGFGRVAWSDDGKDWNVVSDGIYFVNFFDIAYGNGVLVAGGHAGRMVRSTDGGLTWDSVTSGNTFGTYRIDGIAYGGRRFIAVGVGGRMAWSYDGKNWTAVSGDETTFGTDPITAIGYGNGKFIAGGNGRMAWSQSE